MSTLLDHPQAQELLDQTTVSAADVRALARRLTPFLQRYLPLFTRAEQRDHAATILRGKLTGLDRKTTEPIALQAKQKRRPLQLFVGAGGWSDQRLRTELRRHVRDELGDANGVFILDGFGVPKKGAESCGVARQWCGHLGKVDNCQVGYFLAYSARRGKTLLDARLYLPEHRAQDRRHRNKTYVPKDITFQEGWRLSLQLLDRHRNELPHGWVVGDDEFGRVTDLRAALRFRRERYVLDVPCNTLVRDLSERRPPRHEGGRERLAVFERADAWAARQPRGRWRTMVRPGGEKGPRRVRVLQQMVQTKEDNCVGPRERLVVIQSVEKKPRTWYTLSNAAKEVPWRELVLAQGAKHGVEELFAEGNGEVGLDHYEVRSWTGWEHHMTLSLLALWFLQLGRLQLGKKHTGDHGVAVASNPDGVAEVSAEECEGNRGDGDESAAA